KRLSAATIKKLHSIISSSLKYAETHNLISKNPSAIVKTPPVRSKDIEVWEEKDMIAFLDFTKNEPDYIMYHLALYTGMRKGEILGLRWQDIDFEQKKIRVMQSYTPYGFSRGKTLHSRRVIDIDDDTINELKKKSKII